MDISQNKMDVSVIIPVFNESENINLLYSHLTEVLQKINRTYEIIFIDDGSSDSTPYILQSIFDKDNSVKVIRLRRNFGQSAALQAGFDLSKGKIVIAMDGDLQHNPDDIPDFLSKIDEGYDIVSGWRKKRVDSLLFRRLPSYIANLLIRRISDVPIHDFGTTFKAYRREAVREIQLYSNFHRFIPALLRRIGFRITEIPIQNTTRQRGKSKYGLSRTGNVLLDLSTLKFLLSFADKPMQLFGMIGISIWVLLLLIILIFFANTHIFNWSIRENFKEFLGFILIFIMGIQMIMSGLIAEIV